MQQHIYVMSISTYDITATRATLLASTTEDRHNSEDFQHDLTSCVDV